MNQVCCFRSNFLSIFYTQILHELHHCNLLTSNLLPPSNFPGDSKLRKVTPERRLSGLNRKSGIELTQSKVLYLQFFFQATRSNERTSEENWNLLFHHSSRQTGLNLSPDLNQLVNQQVSSAQGSFLLQILSAQAPANPFVPKAYTSFHGLAAISISPSCLPTISPKESHLVHNRLITSTYLFP